jgi:hypothetical protein
LSEPLGGVLSIRKLIAAIRAAISLGGSYTMATITLTSDPTLVPTPGPVGQLGTFGGTLYVHLTGAVDTTWLNMTAVRALLAEKTALDAFLAEKAALDAWLAQKSTLDDLHIVWEQREHLEDLAVQSTNLLALSEITPSLQQIENALAGSSRDVFSFVVTIQSGGGNVAPVYAGTGTGCRGLRVGNRYVLDAYGFGTGAGAGSGGLLLSLPVAAAAAAKGGFTPVGSAAANGTAQPIWGFINPGSSFLSLWKLSGGNLVALTGADQAGSTNELSIHCCFEV